MRTAVKLLLDAIAERGLSVQLDNGRAVLRGKREDATPELMTAMKHFRAEILEAVSIVETEPVVEEVNEEDTVEQPKVPAGAEIVVMDAEGYTDKAMKGPPYMWCWIGGDRWRYVEWFPVPQMLR